MQIEMHNDMIATKAFMEYSILENPVTRTAAGVANIRLYGIKGDGSDTTKDIQEALNSIETDVVVFPRGIYNVTTDLMVKKGLNIIGEDAIFNVSNKVVLEGNQFVKGIVFDGNSNCDMAVHIFGSDVVFSENQIVQMKAKTATWTTGIFVDRDTSGTEIKNNKFSGIQPYVENGIYGDAIGASRFIVAEGVKDCIIESNEFSGMTGIEDGDYVQVIADSRLDEEFPYEGYCYKDSNVVIRKNIFKDVTKSAVKLQASNCIVQGNSIYPNRDGANSAIRGYNLQGVLIKDNFIDFQNTEGEFVFHFMNSSDLNIFDNYIKTIRNKRTLYTAYIEDCKLVRLSGNSFLEGEEAIVVLDNCDIVKITKNVFEKNYLRMNKLNNVEMSENVFTGNLYEVIQLNDSRGASKNVSIVKNIAYVGNRFVQLYNNNKRNIKVISNYVCFSENQYTEIIAYHYEEQDRAEIEVFGNTPSVEIDYGTTSQRPAFAKYVGYQYYDTSLNKPIWWNGTAWNDSEGKVV